MKLKRNDPNNNRWHHLNILNDFQQHCKDVYVYDMRILLCLFRHGNKKGQTIIGSRIGSQQCGISKTTWNSRTNKLRGMGLINYGFTEKSGRRRKYFVCYAKMEEYLSHTVAPQESPNDTTI